MRLLGLAVEHHFWAVAIDALVLWFCASVLRERRPTGSAFAWLLAILLIPYAGIPLYLFFGGRKFRRSAKSKTAIPVELESGAPDPGLPGFAHSLGLGHQDSAVSVDWLDDGVRAFQALMEEIRGAKRSIRIATFLIRNDETGRAVLAALAERAAAGVEVRLLLDDFLRFEAPGAALEQLKEAGGKVGVFMPLARIPLRGRANLRNHRKMALFDGRRAIVGGGNLAREYMGPEPYDGRWKDLSVLLDGRAAAALDAVFRADWEFATKEVLAPPRASSEPGAIAVRVVPSGPDSSSDPIHDALLTMIFRAQRRFWVATPYFVPDESLAKALEIAARRGVEVVLMVPARSNHVLADLVGGPYLRDLAEVGVKVRRHPKMLHAKAVLADDEIAAVGSANFDMRSLFLDFEIALFFTGRTQTSALAKWFEASAAQCAIGAAPAKPLRSGVESVARLLAPLL